jgi:hypothetical protein
MPASRLCGAGTPRDYLDLVADPRIGQDGLRTLACSPYSFVRLAVARHIRTNAPTLTELLAGEFDRWDRNDLLRLVAQHPRRTEVSCSRSCGRSKSCYTRPTSGRVPQ